GVARLPEDAEKYEAGMINFPSIYGAAESVRMMLEIGPDRIERRVLELAGLAADALRRSGASILYDNTNIVAAHWPDRDAPTLAKKLREQRIIVAARHGSLRVSPHFYNTEAEVEALGA